MVERTGLPGPIIRWSIAVLAAAALVIAGYLFWVGTVAGRQPLGCGSGSGCSQVLTSRWSQVLGVPVTVPAAACYFILLLLMWRVGYLPARWRPWAGVAAHLIGGLVFLAAVWFIGLQWFYLQAICPWCVAEHGLGLLMAGLIGWGVPRPWNASDISESDDGANPVTIEADPVRGARVPGKPVFGVQGQVGVGRWLVWGGPAILLTLLIMAQIWGPFTPPAAGRLTGPRGALEGDGVHRQLSLLQGQLTLPLAEVPIMGRADAKHWVVMLFDYCCPHCQTTHGYLREAIDQRPADLAVVLLPSPLNSKCNPHWEQDEPRFAESCELARLALAVWSLNREKFGEFDSWLFASDEPRSYAAALEQAKTWFSAAELEARLNSREIEQQIRRNVDAYQNSRAGRIPVLLSPDFDAVVGRPGSRSELLGILAEELGLEFDAHSSR